MVLWLLWRLTRTPALQRTRNWFSALKSTVFIDFKLASFCILPCAPAQTFHLRSVTLQVVFMLPVNVTKNMVKLILRYLATTRTYGLTLTKKEPFSDIETYSDFYWAGCKSTRKSTTGFVIIVINTPNFWKYIRQNIVALSSTDTKYIALSATAKEMTWVRRLCWEINFQRPFG